MNIKQKWNMRMILKKLFSLLLRNFIKKIRPCNVEFIQCCTSPLQYVAKL